jgi:CRP-like cAMP-binding protein
LLKIVSESGVEHPRTGCSECPVFDGSPWRDAQGEVLADLERWTRHLRYEPGQDLFFEGEPAGGVYCIQSGVVALGRRGANEARSVVGLRHPGDTLGYRSFVTNSPHTHSAQATTECEVCFIDRPHLERLLEANPPGTQRFIAQLVDQIDEAESLFIGSRVLSVRGRLANALLVLRDRHASAAEDGCLTFTLPFTRQLLASLIGARTESLSRAIRALEMAGVARFDGRTVVVPDLDGLLDEIEQQAIGSRTNV